MGFAVAAPMAMGAITGALLNKENPLLGGALGAFGGAALGPLASGLTSAGSAASTAALESGLGSAAASEAAKIAAASELTGAGLGTEQIAMMAGQTAGEFGNAGVQSALSGAGVNPYLAKLGAFAAGGPQGAFANMGTGDMLKMGARGLNMASRMGGSPQPIATPQAPPPAMPARPTMPSQVAPARPFVTGMPQLRRRNDIWGMQ